jgi:hypothetical protein
MTYGGVPSPTHCFHTHDELYALPMSLVYPIQIRLLFAFLVRAVTEWYLG